MVTFRLGGTQDGVRVVGGVSMGVVKLILRTLTAMDYQVSVLSLCSLLSVIQCLMCSEIFLFRCALVFNKLECLVSLKAGLNFHIHYQLSYKNVLLFVCLVLWECVTFRRRLFIWGARRGEVLPEFPRPSHCFIKRSSLTINMPSATGQQIKYQVRFSGHSTPTPHKMKFMYCAMTSHLEVIPSVLTINCHVILITLNSA